MEGTGLLGYQLPPGFRFHPTDQELISCYLSRKVDASLPPASAIIAEIDLYKFNPWELPEKALFGEGEWFFFSSRDRKYPNGARPNRAAGCGYWKATGTDKPILPASGSRCLGVKKALVFYKGRPPKGTKTEWVMHEYRLLDAAVTPTDQPPKCKDSMILDDWVLCRVRRKCGPPAESDWAAEIPSTPLSFFTNTQKEEEPMAEWSDQQLLGYLLGSRESSWDSSEPASAISLDLGGRGCAEVQQPPAPQLVDSALSTIKRKLSFNVLDELILQQQASKRQPCWQAGKLSQADSGSAGQDFMSFWYEPRC